MVDERKAYAGGDAGGRGRCLCGCWGGDVSFANVLKILVVEVRLDGGP